MECSFYVGQQVVCVDASLTEDPRFNSDLHGLREGQIYTVREVRASPDWWGAQYPDRAGQIWVHLQEVLRPSKINSEDVGYRHTRFRPATDISVFEAMLQAAPAPQKKSLAHIA